MHDHPRTPLFAAPGRRALALAAAAGLLLAGLGVPSAASAAVSPDAPVVISEVYGGGGNTGATLKRDFIELYNKSAAPVDLAGWSVQYASVTGTSWSVTPLVAVAPATNVILQPGEHLLVAEAAGTGGGGDPAPDVSGTIAMSGTNAKVALVNTVTPLVGTTGNTALPQVIDYVGWGPTASEFAGTGPAPATSNTTSIARDANKTNTANNAADFIAGAPTPTARGTVTPDPDPEPEPDPEFRTIAEVQGTGAGSPFVGDTVITRGVVTASYPTGGFNGYVLQTEGTGGVLDASHTASDAIFVYSPATAGTVPLGAYVEITGKVTEFPEDGTPQLTEITVGAASDVVTLSEPFTAPLPAVVSWPATAEGREVLESMLIAPTGDFTVSNTFSTNQYGEVGLAAGTEPLRQPTDVAIPGSDAAKAVAADNAARAVALDDGTSINFLGSANTGLTPPWISTTAPVRVGAAVTFTDPLIVDWRNSVWKLQPTAPLNAAEPQNYPATFENDRTAAPESVGGDVSVASFNVLNYFTTLGTADATCTAFRDRTGDGVTVNSGCDQRGAWDAADLARQQVKIVEAINALDASVVGLLEIENSAALGEQPDEALSTLVAALNEDAGESRWAFVSSPANLPDPLTLDVITNAIIYQPALVSPLGASTALGDQSDDGEAFQNAREPIAQAFAPVGGGEDFVVVVNHFKSKGSAGPWPGDKDANDGQGASNESRERQATALRDWVATDPTGAGTDSVLLVGDFNAYGQEDPLQILYGAGFVDAEHYFGLEESSYSFSGLSGSLDHVLLSGAAAERATGADIWTINSPESLALEYSRYNYHGTLFYTADPFRSSDHDPVKVGLEKGLETSSTTLELGKTEVVYGATGTVTATATVTSDVGAAGSVEFLVDGAVVATAPLTAGVAKADLALPGTLAAGAHAIVARYTGSADVAGSESTPVVITVRAATSDTDLMAVLPVHVNKVLPATLLAWVTLETGKAPVGVIEFREGATVVGTVPVVRGSASFTLPNNLTRGIHKYTATFVPAEPANVAGSTSGETAVRVAR